LSRGSILRTDWLLLTCVCGFLFFYGLANFGLMGADEPRYAQVAREMLARHDWITPTLGGGAWLEKPALYYWQAMLAYKIFGVSDWAARLPSGVDATLLVGFVYFFLRRFRPGAELDGAVMTASAAGVIGFARAASMDMPLATAFSIGMMAWYAWHESQNKSFLAAFYVFIGLGMLAKGPVAPFLAALIIAAFTIAKGDWRLIIRTLWVPGILLFCAVSLPWYVAVQLKNPQFFHEFFLQHNLARFGTNLYHHKEPFWYYLPVTVMGLLPWTVFVLAALVEIAGAWWRERRAMLESKDAFNVFLILWLIVPVVFFSISQSKLPGYIVPALPAGSLLLAEYVRRHSAEGERPGFAVLVLHAIVAASVLVPALMIQHLLQQHRMPWNRGTEISLIIAVVLAIAIVLSLRSRIGLGGLRFVTLVPVVLSVAMVLRLGASSLDDMLSARPLANALASVEGKRLPIAVFQVRRELEYGLVFYRDQMVSRYELGQIPAQEHFVVAPAGSQTAVAAEVSGRRVTYIGSFAPQNLEYYWVAAGERR